MPSSTRKRILRCLIVAAAIGAAWGQARAAATGSLTIRWDANTTDPDMSAYRIYLSTDPGVFNLTPAEAATRARTVTLPASATETTVASLDPALVYWVAITSLDTSSNESDFSGVASAQPRDVTLPAVSMTAPAPAATVSGTVTVSATASDDVGVAGVRLLLDGADLGAEDTSAPFSILWSTTSSTNGAHTLSAIARDAAGNAAASASVVVQVSNTAPPESGCPAGEDRDLDGICDAGDNCPAVYNPAQTNTDKDAEGGDACDITVTAPLDGSVTCADPPPTITWSPEIYNVFRVFVGTNAQFSVKITSDKKGLTTTFWTVPAASWTAICGKGSPYLFIKVLGKISGTRSQEYSEVGVIRVR